MDLQVLRNATKTCKIVLFFPRTMEMGLTMIIWRAETWGHMTISLLHLSIPEYKVRHRVS